MTWNSLQKICIINGGNDISYRDTIYQVKPYLAHINDQSSTGSTALHLACTGENNNLVRYLLRKGATIQPNIEGETALHWACHSAPISTVQALLRYSTLETIRHQDKSGKTALDWAIEAERPDIINLFKKLHFQVRECKSHKM